MAEPRDISEAVREAVERATSGPRGRAQAAADDLAGSVDDIVKGAEKGLTARRRSVQEAVGRSLPATQEDIREVRTELRRIARRLDAIEERLPTAGKSSRTSGSQKPSATRSGRAKGGSGRSGSKS